MKSALIIEGRSRDTIKWYSERGYRGWGQAWADLLNKRYSFDTRVVHHRDMEDVYIDMYNLVVFCGSGMNIYQPSVDTANYMAQVRRVINENKPIIGSCFGMQAYCAIYGCQVSRMEKKEFGVINVITNMQGSKYKAYASHNDHVVLNATFKAEAVNEFCLQAATSKIRPFLGLQHHPEWEVKDISYIAERDGSDYTPYVFSDSRYVFIDRFIKENG